MPDQLFEKRKIFTVRLPYLTANKKFSKLLNNKIEDYTNGKVKLVIIWNTHKIQSLFNHKDETQHHSCVAYRGVCLCGTDYIGEFIRNFKIRWKEHSPGKDKNSYCVKHLNDNFISVIMSFDGLFFPCIEKLFKAEDIRSVLHKNTPTFIKYSSER